MTQNGAAPVAVDHRDFDARSLVTVIPTVFPESFDTDAHLTMPNQMLPDGQFDPVVPPLPYGCTDYAQADIATDLSGTLKNPFTIEQVTHANMDKGGDLRQSLLATLALGWITGFFRIRADGHDYFDSMRIAMLSGGTEKRSISLAMPWYPNFDTIDNTGILSTPMNFDASGTNWHNPKICGWKTIQGQPYLAVKSWKGAGYGDGGFAYASRPLINSLMSVRGTAAFIATKEALPTIQKIVVSWIEYAESIIRGFVFKWK